MNTVLAFPTRRRRRLVATPLFPAVVYPYPLTRYAGEVDRMARHLRSLPTLQERSDAMVRRVEIEWTKYCKLGVDDQTLETMVIQFASCVWAVVNRNERGGVA